MKYCVRYKVTARYHAEVEADSVEEAKKLAEDIYFDADFGDAEDVDGEPISVEYVDGTFVWEK